jgi:dephospho-CoA kinase
MKQICIAIEGHDASGKTTVATALAEEMGGAYIKPFRYLGDFLEWTWRTQKFHLTDQVARMAIADAAEDNADKVVLVFDRHWLTHFTVMPPHLLENWGELPITIMLWTDPDTTRERLRIRGEEPYAYDHDHYCPLYKTVAARYRVPVVETTSTTIEEAVRRVRAIISATGAGAQLGR